MKPLIGITVDVQSDIENPRTKGLLKLNVNYADMVTQAGGNPILITPFTDTKEMAHLVDGWLIPGGDDMDASHFGEENHPKVGLQDPLRWKMEEALYQQIDPLLPILGICYGCQFLNVKHGGTLLQHVPDQVGHEQHTGGTLQTYKVEESSRLRTFSGHSAITGASYHHQAVGKLGENLEAVAFADDGIVEAIEDPNKPFLVGVQWHPERTPQDEATLNLFRSFIQAAELYRASK